MLKRYSAFCLVLFFISLPFSAGQDVPAAPEPETQPKPAGQYKIGVNVNEATLDVVVLDKKGNPIVDLAAEDFEVSVAWGLPPSPAKSSVYIDNKSGTATWNERKDATNLPQFSSRTLKEEEVRRTILFLVDDLTMEDGVPKQDAFAGLDEEQANMKLDKLLMETPNLYYARLGMKKFLETQMQPSDMIAVMYTGAGSSALNMFTSDKSRITAQIDSKPHRGGFYGGNLPATVSYSISALKDMPGRKILIILTGNLARLGGDADWRVRSIRIAQKT